MAGEVLEVTVLEYNWYRAKRLFVQSKEKDEIVDLIWAWQTNWVKPYLTEQKALSDGW